MGSNEERAVTAGTAGKGPQRAAAEDALTREREFSRCLLESMADGVVACDENGILALFNRTAREWHGVDPRRIPQEEWARYYDLFRADGVTPLPTDEIPLARAFRGETVVDAGMTIKAKGRAPRFILANGSAIIDAAGRRLGAVVVMRDVTELRRVEEQLRKSNEELEKRVVERTTDLQNANTQLQAELEKRGRVENVLRLIQFTMDSASDAVFWVKQDGSYFYANKAASGLLGYEIPALLAMKVSDVNPAHGGAAWQVHWTELKERKVLRFEAELIRKDGSNVPVEITANHIEFGGQEYNCAFVREIAHRRAAERALQESEAFLDSVVENIPNMIFVKDARELKFVRFNKAGEELLGYGREYLYGKNDFDFFPQEEAEFFTTKDREVLKRKMLVDILEEPIETRLRGKRILHTKKIPIFDAQGEPLYLLGISEDITERKRAEDTLFRETAENRAMAELTGNILTAGSVEDIANEVLRKAQHLTGSRFGYVGYIDQVSGCLVCPTMTHDIWDHCGVPGKSIIFEKFGGLWGWVLTHKKPLMTNDPSADSRSAGTPPGHIPIKNFLSAPAFYGDVLVGQIALANADRPFREEDIAVVERMATILALGLRRQMAEDELRSFNERLDQKVRERTSELETKIAEIERMNKLFVGRELRMKELKEKIHELEKRSGG